MKGTVGEWASAATYVAVQLVRELPFLARMIESSYLRPHLVCLLLNPLLQLFQRIHIILQTSISTEWTCQDTCTNVHRTLHRTLKARPFETNCWSKSTSRCLAMFSRSTAECKYSLLIINVSHEIKAWCFTMSTLSSILLSWRYEHFIPSHWIHRLSTHELKFHQLLFYLWYSFSVANEQLGQIFQLRMIIKSDYYDAIQEHNTVSTSLLGLGCWGAGYRIVSYKMMSKNLLSYSLLKVYRYSYK